MSVARRCAHDRAAAGRRHRPGGRRAGAARARGGRRAVRARRSSSRKALIGGARSTRPAPRFPRDASASAERRMPCCSARSAARSGTTRRAKVRPEQGLLGDAQGARPVREPAPRRRRTRALVDASPLRAGAARRRRSGRRARAHRRHLLRREAPRARSTAASAARDCCAYTTSEIDAHRARGGASWRAAARQAHVGGQGQRAGDVAALARVATRVMRDEFPDVAARAHARRCLRDALVTTPGASST